jgi:hypothetical protein
VRLFHLAVTNLEPYRPLHLQLDLEECMPSAERMWRQSPGPISNKIPGALSARRTCISSPPRETQHC